MTPAPTCTVGPSRPIDKPASRPPATRPILCSDTRNETRKERSSGVKPSSRARTTCGMPEPMAPGTKRRVHHSSATVSSGVHNSISHGAQAWEVRICSKPWLAASASSVKPTTTPPVRAA